MSRISCDVTKDLLAPYLDGICSEESRGLVEEHMGECPSCRQFLETLQKKDREVEAPKVDYLRKARRFMNLRAVTGFIVLLALVSMSTLLSNVYGTVPFEFYYIEMPILMLTYAFVLGSRERFALPQKGEWALPVCGLMTTVAAICLQAASLQVISRIDLIPAEELSQIGPRMYRCSFVIVSVAIVLLAVLPGIVSKTGRTFPVSRNLAWLGLNLALAFGKILKTMITPEGVRQLLMRYTGILALEFAAVTLLMWGFSMRRKDSGHMAMGRGPQRPK